MKLKNGVIIDRHFIVNRVLEVLSAPIVLGLSSVLLMPVIAPIVTFVLGDLPPQFYDSVVSRGFWIICLIYIGYLWHKAFTTTPPKDMEIAFGKSSYHHRKNKDS